MPIPDTPVKLDVQSGSPPDDTWKKCQDSAGADIDFCCQFTGGNWPDGQGGPGCYQATGRGNGTLTVHLKLEAKPIWTGNNGSGYKITDVTFDPDNGQCSASGNAPDQRQILDKNDEAVEPFAKYTVVVAYRAGTSGDGKDLYCHPRWRNN